MRVGFYGNNLNYGHNFVRKLRSHGIDAFLWLPNRDAGQDDPAWWSSAGDASWIREVPFDVDPWTFKPRVIDRAVQRLYQSVRGMDVLLFMEDAPALFAGFVDIPKVLLSQGEDILHLPFLVPTLWKGRTAHDLHEANDVPDAALVLGSSVARLARWSLMQSRQRRGIHECDAMVVLPFQAPLVERLQLDARRVHYLQFVLDADVLTERPDHDPRNIDRSLAECDVVFFHPTRHCIDSSLGFTKDNDKLVEAYAEFSKTSRLRTCLVMVEKGIRSDIEASRQTIIERGIEKSVHWLPEMTNIQLRSFYDLPNVVVCDQFNPDVASLGNIGREASFYGVPLITSANADITFLFQEDPPPHIVSADTVEGIVAAMNRLSGLTPAQRAELSTQARNWCSRHLSPDALMPRYIELLEDVVQSHKRQRND